MKRHAARLSPLLALLALLTAHAARAQQAGTALLTFPRQGEPVKGEVVITGAATHPQFDHYELAFAYEPNPTGTWFLLGDPGLSLVQDGQLATWDVSGLTDGQYSLRLQVLGQDGSTLEAVVSGVLIQNTPPTATPPPAPTEPPPPPSPTAEVVVEQPPTPTPEAASPAGTGAPPGTPVPGGESAAGSGSIGGGQIGRAFLGGVMASFGLFLLIGLYSGLRAVLRPRLRRWLRQTLEELQR